VASVRSCENLPPCVTEPMPAGSKMDPLLAKAKPISDGGSTSVISYLRRGKNCGEIAVKRDEGDDVRETTLQIPRSVKMQGRRCSRRRSRDCPAARDKDHGEAGCPHAVHGSPQWSRSPPASRRRLHAIAGGCLKEAVTPWEDCARAGSCQDLWPHAERSPHQSRFAGRACDPMGDPHWSSLFLKDCTPWEGRTLGQFGKNCSPWEGLTLEKLVESCLTLEKGQSVRSPLLRRKEWQRQRVMN